MSSCKKDPITSYGIILFYVKDREIYYLLAQRRDTIEYSDFLRGRYTFSNLKVYFQMMTQEERMRLATYSFEELWDDLWVNKSSKFYTEIFARAKGKFEENKEIMKNFLNDTTSSISEPSWGFPKGKKNYFESEIECAFREFKEETRMTITHVNLLTAAPLKEDFKGTNNKLYRTVLYLAQVDLEIPVKKIITGGLRDFTVSEEISNLGWYTLSEAANFLNSRRYKLLQEANEKIRDFLYTKKAFEKTIF